MLRNLIEYSTETYLLLDELCIISEFLNPQSMILKSYTQNANNNCKHTKHNRNADNKNSLFGNKETIWEHFLVFKKC